MLTVTSEAELKKSSSRLKLLQCSAVLSRLHAHSEPVGHGQREGHAVGDGLPGDQAEPVEPEGTADDGLHLRTNVEAQRRQTKAQ